MAALAAVATFPAAHDPAASGRVRVDYTKVLATAMAALAADFGEISLTALQAKRFG